MQKVITINLNGQAYQLDEDAYDALRTYLDNARTALKDNPDLIEIMADLEQAIAEKCQKVLSPNKSVVSSSEITRILAEMGPVDSAASDEQASAAGGSHAGQREQARTSDAPRRLYRIHEGAWIGGVCTGIAAYLNIDVMLVRGAFVVLAVATKGPVGIVTYLFLMFVLPDANTSEEHAAAHGAPFNAKEIVDQVTTQARRIADQVKHSSAFTTGWKHKGLHHDWRRDWARERREWRRQWRHAKREARSWRGSPVPPAPTVAAPFAAPPAGYAARVVAGFLVPVLALASAGFFWIWAAAMMSLLSTGAIFGRPLPSDLPMWAAALILVLLFNMVAWPLQYARNASHLALGGRHYYGGIAAWDGMMGLGFWILCGWAAYRYFPEVNQFMENLPAVRENLRLIFRFG
jgi:phage shock protein PspC (stress-responsive transcriptional regulator)